MICCSMTCKKRKQCGRWAKMGEASMSLDELFDAILKVALGYDYDEIKKTV